MIPLNGNGLGGNWATLLLAINADNRINYSKVEQEIALLIAMQVSGIYTNGTAGEFYNQTEDEFDRIHLLLAEKCKAADMPFQIGCSCANPIASLERVKRAKALHPAAIQIILPDWTVPSMIEIIGYLERMVGVASPVPLVLYNPPHAKKKLIPEDFGTIERAGIRLAGCKTAAGDELWYKQMKERVPALALFVPGHHLATGFRQGAAGSCSNVACLHPGAAQGWYEMMRTDIDAALEMEARIQFFMKTQIVPYIHERHYSNQAVDKFLAAVGGWADIGTNLRWPYKGIPIEEVEKARRACKKLLPEFFPPPNTLS